MIEPASPTPLYATAPASAPPQHWVLPFASSLSAPCQHALSILGKSDSPAATLPALPQLVNLRKLLGRMVVVARLEGDEYSLSMPHERVLAQEMAWPSDCDGQMPWAAWWAAQDGLTLAPDRCWGMLSPGHWLMGRDHLTLLDPHTQALSDAESHTLLEAVRPLFESDGWTLQWGAATRWYVSHPCLADLPTASLERVIGRNPDVWLTDQPQARMVRRLQSEVQMLLYQHPVNDEREARGQSTVNSFWLSGCGKPPALCRWPATTCLIDDLRAPLLADDMPQWLQAWAHVDATVLHAIHAALDRGERVQLTLCGERHAVSLAPAPVAGALARLRQTLRHLLGSGKAPHPVTLLSAL